jgi:hypothetical protein
MTFTTEIKLNDGGEFLATRKSSKSSTGSSFYITLPAHISVVFAATIITSAVTLPPQPINHSSAITMGKQYPPTARTIVDAQYQSAHTQVMEQMQIEHLEPLNTEDDLLAAAVNITKRK